MTTPFAMQRSKIGRSVIALVLAAAAALTWPNCASASAGRPGSQLALVTIAGHAMTDNQLAQTRAGSASITGSFTDISRLPAGVLFVAFAFFKFHQHKSKPGQVLFRGPFARAFGMH